MSFNTDVRVMIIIMHLWRGGGGTFIKGLHKSCRSDTITAMTPEFAQNSLTIMFMFYVMKRKPHLHNGTVTVDTDRTGW